MVTSSFFGGNIMNQAARETEGQNAELELDREASLDRSTPGEYIDKALHLLGAQLKSVAGFIKELAPDESTIRKDALSRASKRLDTAGQYMLDEDVSENVTSYLARHPVRSLGASFAIGVVAANLIRLIRR
jgi:hypothetical protein